MHHLFPPTPLPKPASFLRQKTQHKGTRQPKGNWSDGWFSDGAIVSPVSRLPSRLLAPDFQYKAMHRSVNTQKPKATHQEAPASVLKSSWASAKVQLPPTPPPTPLGLLSKPAKDSRAWGGKRDHKLTPLLVGHIHTSKLDFPCTFLLHSDTGCCLYKGESLSSSNKNLRSEHLKCNRTCAVRTKVGMRSYAR